jgi:hypothetical protein
MKATPLSIRRVPGAEAGGKRAQFFRARIASPKEFHKESFRTITPGTGRHKMVVGCPTAHPYVAGRCLDGMEVQSVLVRKRAVAALPRRAVARRIAANPNVRWTAHKGYLYAVEGTNLRGGYGSWHWAVRRKDSIQGATSSGTPLSSKAEAIAEAKSVIDREVIWRRSQRPAARNPLLMVVPNAGGYKVGDKVVIDADETPWHGQDGVIQKITHDGENFYVKLKDGPVEEFQRGELAPYSSNPRRRNPLLMVVPNAARRKGEWIPVWNAESQEVNWMRDVLKMAGVRAHATESAYVGQRLLRVHSDDLKKALGASNKEFGQRSSLSWALRHSAKETGFAARLKDNPGPVYHQRKLDQARKRYDEIEGRPDSEEWETDFSAGQVSAHSASLKALHRGITHNPGAKFHSLHRSLYEKAAKAALRRGELDVYNRKDAQMVAHEMSMQASLTPQVRRDLEKAAKAELGVNPSRYTWPRWQSLAGPFKTLPDARLEAAHQQRLGHKNARVISIPDAGVWYVGVWGLAGRKKATGKNPAHYDAFDAASHAAELMSGGVEMHKAIREAIAGTKITADAVYAELKKGGVVRRLQPLFGTKKPPFYAPGKNPLEARSTGKAYIAETPEGLWAMFSWGSGLGDWTLFAMKRTYEEAVADAKRRGMTPDKITIAELDAARLSLYGPAGRSAGTNPGKDWHRSKRNDYYKRYADDVKAGHKEGAEFWRGAFVAEAHALAAEHAGKARIAANCPKICALRKAAKAGTVAQVGPARVPARVAKAFLHFYDGQSDKGKAYLESLSVPNMILAAAQSARGPRRSP